MTTVKITELTNIGANLATSTLVPVVNMAGTPTTQKTTVGNIANLILEGAGVDYPEASVALLAQTVSNAAQPNITSTGTLASLTVSGNTNLGAVANIRITGGTDGYVLQTDGAGNLTWTAQTGGGGSNGTPGGSNTQIQFNDAGVFGGNSGFTFNKTTGIFTSPFVAGNGNGLSNIQGANVSGAVSFATTANSVAVANVSGIGNIATANFDGNTSNVLHGDGTWSADVTNYGNSNVANYLPTYTGNIGNLSFQYAGNLATIIGKNGSFVKLYGPDDTIFGCDQGNAAIWSNGSIEIRTGIDGIHDKIWTFNNLGSINVPDGSASYTKGRIQSANGYPTLLGYGSGGHGGPELDWMDGNDPQNMDDTAVVRNTMYLNDEGLYIGMNENGNTTPTFTGSWTFDSTGNFTIPQGGGIGTYGMGWPGFYSNNGYLSIVGKSSDPTYSGQEISQIFFSDSGNAGTIDIITRNLNTSTDSFWRFDPGGYTIKPNEVVENTTNSVVCNAGGPTVIYTATSSGRSTIKLLIQVEGVETLGGQWDTQSCEMVVARGLRNSTVVGSVYGLAYTSVAPLATFNAVWNATTSRVEITCTPTSTFNVEARVHVIELTTSA